MSLEIKLIEDRTVFTPGEKVSGKAAWQLDQDPKSVELRLFWYTQGKGDEDLEIVQEITFDNPAMQESRPFSLVMPIAPYSFSGRLVSLIWSLELVSGKHSAMKEIILSPFGYEVDLTSSRTRTAKI